MPLLLVAPSHIQIHAEQPNVLMRAWEALGLWGYETLRAHDGETAVAVALEKAPDVVVLDIGLPGLDGFEIARRLRAQPARAPRIIGVSGHAQTADRTQSAEAGFMS